HRFGQANEARIEHALQHSEPPYLARTIAKREGLDSPEVASGSPNSGTIQDNSKPELTEPPQVSLISVGRDDRPVVSEVHPLLLGYLRVQDDRNVFNAAFALTLGF